MHLSATTSFCVSCGSLKVLYTIPQDCSTTNKAARLLKRQKLNFRHVHFLCDLCGFSERHKTAARHARLLQDTQGVRTTDVIFRQPRICLTKAARLSQDDRALYRKAAARMVRNVRLQLKIARLQCGNRTSYRFVLRQSCRFCMTALRQPCM